MDTGMVAPVPELTPETVRTRRSRDQLVWVAIAGGVVPLVVAVVAIAQYRWYPIGDLAQATLRQHSFWSDPPLVGPAGRIEGFGQQGNHPGPAMFWSTWPLWAVLGRTPWAHQAATAAISLLVFVATVLAVRRHFTWKHASAVAVLATVLMRSWGPEPLTQPWNPYVALVPFFAFVVLSWLAADGRPGVLPAAVAAGSFCIQSHVGYAPAVGGILAVAAVLLLVDGWRRAGAPGPVTVGLWLLAAAAVGLALWLPPLIDQWSHDPGNLRIILETFNEQTGSTIGFGDGARVLLTQLNPVGNWLLGTEDVMGSVLPGVLLLGAWVVAAISAIRDRHRALTRLNAVILVALAAALYWAARLDSVRLLYLVQWFWSITALVVLSVGWTAWRLLAPAVAARLDERSPTAVRAALAVLAAVAALNAVVFAAQATQTEPSEPRYSDTLAHLAGPTADGLDPEARYLLQWVDPNDLGGSGFGLLLELESRGFDLGVPWPWSAAAEPHRVRAPEDADRIITVVTGDENIRVARDLPQVTELAWYDHRSGEDQIHYLDLEQRARRELATAGRNDLADAIDRTIWIALIDPGVPDTAFDTLTEMLELGQASAVFVSDAPLPDLVGLR